jgi:hypothetical protein
MEEIGIDLEAGDSPLQFIQSVFDEVCSRQHRDPKVGIHPSDFFYDMIIMENDFWMNENHPIALMLVENKREPLISFKSKAGVVSVYPKDLVTQCRDHLIHLLQKENFKIL